MVAGDDASLDATTTLTVAGLIDATGDALLESGQAMTVSGSVIAGAAATLDSGAALDLQLGGLVQSGTTATLTAVGDATIAGTVDAAGNALLTAGQAITVGIRPEKIAISREEPAGARNAMRGLVHDLGYFGKDSLYRVKLPTETILSVNSVNARRAGENERVAQWEDQVWLSFDPTSVILLVD